MCEQQKTWHILGAGAIGSLWAARLHSAGVPVRLILSPRRKRQHLGPTATIRLCKNINSSKETVELHKIEVAKEDDRIQQLLIATKANDVMTALNSCRQQLENSATIVSLSNGMGYHKSIASDFPTASILAITTTEGAYIDENNRIVLAGKGQSKIAQVSPAGDTANLSAEQAGKQLSVVGHRLQSRKDCQRMLLDKLLINACINGLTAIHGCENGKLLTEPEIISRLEELIEECQSIARVTKQTALANALSKKVRRVITATSANYSSTYTDIANHRVSEIAFINGYLLELAQQHNISTPVNAALVTEINELESGFIR